MCLVQGILVLEREGSSTGDSSTGDSSTGDSSTGDLLLQGIVIIFKTLKELIPHHCW